MSLPFCKFFISTQGCRFGNKCRYKHPEPFLNSSDTFVKRADNQNEGTIKVTPSSTTAQAPLCNTNISSFKKQDEGIVKSAEYPDLEEVFDRSNENGCATISVPSDILNPQLLTAQKPKKIPHNGEQSQSIKNELKSSKRCHYFSQFGTCKYGDGCQFTHILGQQRLAPRFQQRSSWSGHRNPESSYIADKYASHRGWMKESHNEKQNEDKRISPNVTRGRRFQSNSSAASVGSFEYEHKSADQNDGEEIRNSRKDFFVRKVCPFFPSGRCWRGKRCKFLHQAVQVPSSAEDKDDDYERESPTLEAQLQYREGEEKESRNDNSPAKGAKQNAQSQNPRVPYIPQGVRRWQRSNLDDTEASRLRRTEIELLVKRFPKSKVKVERDTQGSFECVVTFTPTDPDWPFDVKNYDLQLTIPNDYPLEMLAITVPSKQDLPETVRRYLEVSILEWLEEKKKELEDKGQVELMFRPFLRWLDRSIEDVVTDGLRQLKRELTAKAAGFQFISAKELQKQYQDNPNDDEISDDENTDEDKSEDSSQEDEDDSSNSVSEDDEYSDDNEQSSETEQTRGDTNGNRTARHEKLRAMLAEPIRKGTEIALKNLQMKESVGTIYIEKIFLAIQCERCKGTSEFLTSGGRTNLVQCGRCAEKQLVTFRPALVHHFSAVIGYLDLEGCLPFDVILQNCSIVANCLQCSKETKLGALHPGQIQNSWCRVCHQKMKIAADGVRFTQLEPSATQDLKNMLKVVVPRQRRLPKDPAIQEGKPLPSFGTCKHYKKSYRWLRFPCCGKAYPCDLCHDANEDHEMKLANRMICGFCCKEQVYAADRPCKGCDLNLTKVHTPHWEGGQGCRDKITMSRFDKQKHRGMSKTTSKHAHKVQDMQSKKKTKLRHN